jgi:proteasome lid subunit RPN8/RPN11
MLTVTSTFVRPSTSVEFFADEAFNTYRNATYIQTGKLTQVSDTTSPDGLTRTIVNDWTTRADFIAFKQDQAAIDYLEARRQFCAANGIVHSHEFEFAPSEGDPAPTV